MEQLKLLIHVAQPDRWDMAVANGLNFLKAKREGEEFSVKIVANADAITRCTACDRKLFDQLKQLILEGGEVYLCENALRNFGIPLKRVPDIFKTVPAGIKTLAELQTQGWHYIRP